MKLLSLIILIIGGGAAAAGCGTQCNASCISPGFYAYTPTGLPSPLVDVTADSPCVAKLFPGDGGPAGLTVTDDVATQGAVCILHGHLADGQVVTATVTYGQQAVPACCPFFLASGGDFTLSDAGTGGG
jgi:hypothetical protein